MWYVGVFYVNCAAGAILFLSCASFLPLAHSLPPSLPPAGDLKKKCLQGQTETLTLDLFEEPDPTYFPSLLEGNLKLSLGVATTTATAPTIGNGLGNVGGVMWNGSAVASEFMNWTLFPSSGLLLPGEK